MGSGTCWKCKQPQPQPLPLPLPLPLPHPYILPFPYLYPYPEPGELGSWGSVRHIDPVIGDLLGEEVRVRVGRTG
jgi:hypothetical protein